MIGKTYRATKTLSNEKYGWKINVGEKVQILKRILDPEYSSFMAFQVKNIDTNIVFNLIGFDEDIRSPYPFLYG